MFFHELRPLIKTWKIRYEGEHGVLVVVVVVVDPAARLSSAPVVCFRVVFPLFVVGSSGIDRPPQGNTTTSP